MSVIVSLTSYGRRVSTVHLTIRSLKNQSFRPDKIVLWLAEDEFSLKTLPPLLLAEIDDLFEVRFTADVRSYKKLIPSLSAFPNSVLVTFDDDIEYKASLLECLVDSHNKHPDSVVCSRAKLIKFQPQSDELSPYGHWPLLKNSAELKVPYCAMPIGYGGVLYPANSLDATVNDVSLFSKLAPSADDVWFKAMSLLSKKTTVVIPFQCFTGSKEIQGTQEIALYKKVNMDNKNNDCLTGLIEFFPSLKEMLLRDDFSSIPISMAEYESLQKINDAFSKEKSIVDFFIRAAIDAESANYKLALKLMTKARELRPNGPLIKKKIEFYKSKVNDVS